MRVLYRGGEQDSGRRARVEQLRQVGGLYRLALEMGTRYEPDTMAGAGRRRESGVGLRRCSGSSWQRPS